jgi:hypothetical protein
LGFAHDSPTKTMILFISYDIPMGNRHAFNVQAQFRLEQTGKNDLPSSVVISSSASEVAIEGRRILWVKLYHENGG